MFIELKKNLKSKENSDRNHIIDNYFITIKLEIRNVFDLILKTFLMSNFFENIIDFALFVIEGTF